MAPSHKLTILAALTLLLACDAGTHAVATPPAAPFLAAAKADKPSPAERKARRAAKREKAGQGKEAGKTAAPGKTAEHPQPAKKSTATPTATPTASAAALPVCPPDNALTYRSFGDGFLRTWCTGCHSSTLAADARQDAPGAVNFDRAALYKPHARDVYDRAVLEAHAVAVDPNAAAAPMPPAGVIPEADRRRLAQWIACGSPGT